MKLKLCGGRMASEIKVEVTHKETIRPSSPTPHHLRSAKFSVFDQLTPEIYVPLLLFYPKNSSNHSLVVEKSKLLKRSLSETLTHFYPFAGTIQSNNVSICCNDHGAAFLEAQVNCPMSKVLDKPDVGMEKQLIPNNMQSLAQSGTGYLLVVQVNFFQCGGIAIGVNISHKIIDAYTLSKFVDSWAAIALGSARISTSTDAVPLAEFGVGASLFPPLDFLNSPQPSVGYVLENCVTRRFVFDASKIAALKSKAASATVPNPTRVEVVSALVWKCATEASRSNLGFVRPSMWCQMVNMRKILMQPSAENLMGNLVGFFVAKTEESEVDLQSLVAKLRKGLEEFKVNFGNEVSVEDLFELFKEYATRIVNKDIDNYCSTSWCRFPFYETDFGWGRPSWTSGTHVEIKNMSTWMDLRDGKSVELRLTLKEEDMAMFENNKELLAYASLNPAVI